jgi:hypothetical protein
LPWWRSRHIARHEVRRCIQRAHERIDATRTPRSLHRSGMMP